MSIDAPSGERCGAVTVAEPSIISAVMTVSGVEA
jgi:hypothetical protein